MLSGVKVPVENGEGFWPYNQKHLFNLISLQVKNLTSHGACCYQQRATGTGKIE